MKATRRVRYISASALSPPWPLI